MPTQYMPTLHDHTAHDRVIHANVMLAYVMHVNVMHAYVMHVHAVSCMFYVRTNTDTPTCALGPKRVGRRQRCEIFSLPVFLIISIHLDT